MQIRLMTKEDAGEIADVLNVAIASSVAHFGTVPTDAEEVLQSWHATSETYPWLVAVGDDGGFMGFAKGSPWNTRQAYRWTVETGIYLNKESQGMGVGKTLYTKLFDVLALQGYRIVLAGVSIPNPASEQLHESMGMTVVGDVTPAGYKFGKWISVRRYQFHLGKIDSGTVPRPIRSVSSVWDELNG